MAAVFGDAAVMQFVGDGNPLDRAAISTLLEKIFTIYRTDPQFHVWAVEEHGAYAGHAELKRRKDRTEYELIYFLRAGVWGRGLGGRVVDALLERARGLHLPFVIATVCPQNAASLAILRRRGFQPDPDLTRELGADAFRLNLGAS